MTRINKLVMHGFKSFARHTELVFGDNFNCVLGPNGAGKSNIIDALCFVLGRLSSKSLRAEKSSNLVYNGGKTKKPMKKAEVSIYFDNSKKTFPTNDPYVKLSRIIGQKGQSTYKINDKKRTRQQILDLMSVAKIDPEGYNIILQGDIIRFTEMHSDERRLLIEEISGISIYEDKKKKALRELEKVDEKLKEAGIVLAERKTYLRELSKDRDQALKFKELESKVKENKASYLYIQIERQEKGNNEQKSRIANYKKKLEDYNNQINEIKKIVEGKKEQINNINLDIEQKGEKDQVEMQRNVEQLKVKLATNKTRVENLRNEIEKIGLREKQLNEDLNELNNQIKELTSEKGDLVRKKESILEEQKIIEKQLEEFRDKNKVDDVVEIEKDIEQLDKHGEEKQKQIEDLRKEQQDLLRKKDAFEFQINSIDESIEKILEIEKEHKSQIEDLKNKKDEFKKSILDLNQRLNESTVVAKQIADKKRGLAILEENLAKLNTKKYSIKENISGSIAVNKLLSNKDIKGIYGTVSELGAADEKYALALHVTAGPRLNSIVVEDDGIAAECIKYLKKNKFGTAVFLPLNKIKERNVNPNINDFLNKKGVHDLAVNLVSFDKKFKKIFSYVFGSTLIVDDIDSARKIGIGKVRMVTLDGDSADISGAMQGGFRHKKNKTAFQEKGIIEQIKNVKEETDKFAGVVKVLEKRRDENDEIINELRKKKAALEGEIIKQEKSLHLDSKDIDASKKTKQELENNVKDAENRLRELDGKIEELTKLLTGSKIKKQQLRNRINQLRNPSLIAELNAFEEKRTELKDRLVQIDADIKNINIQINDMKLPEKESIQAILKQQSKEVNDFYEEIKNLTNQIENDEIRLAEQEKKSQEFYVKYKGLFAERSKISDEIQQEENKMDDLREQSKESEIRMNKVSLIKAEISAKLAGLREEFQQYEGVKINRGKNEEELKRDIHKFEKMVSEIGNVNMKALEIYDEIEKEYQSLLDKKEKLGLEKEDVVGMMQEIEEKKKGLFMKTFEAVNENFRNIFSMLSTKGEASLVLENPENPFDGGLNIKVRLTGKKFLDIRGLSGGEKTMTALAFIFSIQEYEPHSFYILDEVDAALDKHNSEKLAELIRKYVKNAQYIVISHNDAVISEADSLYGISMNEHGVSQVTSLKI